MAENLLRALAQVRTRLLDADELVRAVASGRQKGAAPRWRRVELHYVDLKAGRHLQVTAYDETQAHTSNHAVGDVARDAVDGLLDEPFGNWHVETTTETVQLRVTKKGALLHVSPRAEPAAADRGHDRDKERLLPFAEYFPFPQLDFVRRRFGEVKEFSPGTTARLLPTAIGPAGVTVCNEAMFPDVAAARARAGAAYLVDPANDTWLTPRFSAQQFDIVTLRSVEQRRWLVRASTSGPSAIVDPLGRVTARSQFLTVA